MTKESEQIQGRKQHLILGLRAALEMGQDNLVSELAIQIRACDNAMCEHLRKHNKKSYETNY